MQEVDVGERPNHGESGSIGGGSITSMTKLVVVETKMIVTHAMKPAQRLVVLRETLCVSIESRTPCAVR